MSDPLSDFSSAVARESMQSFARAWLRYAIDRVREHGVVDRTDDVILALMGVQRIPHNLPTVILTREEYETATRSLGSTPK